MLAQIFQLFSDGAAKLLSLLISVLPDAGTNEVLSALQGVMSDGGVIEVVRWINYFVPVRILVTVITTWLGVLMLYVGVKSLSSISTKV